MQYDHLSRGVQLFFNTFNFVRRMPSISPIEKKTLLFHHGESKSGSTLLVSLSKDISFIFNGEFSTILILYKLNDIKNAFELSTNNNSVVSYYYRKYTEIKVQLLI